MNQHWLLFVALVACGESAPATDASAACGAIGTPCGDGCPSPLVCVANACAPVRGDCGGFTGAQCQDPSLTCTYPSSSTAGICMQADEKACMCAIAPDALSDCMPP